MKIKRIKVFTILVFILASISTFPLFIESGNAMLSHSNLLVEDPVYLPFISKHYPQSLFGISLISLDEAGGLTQAVQAGTNWSRKGFIWEEIEPNPGDRNWQVEQELEQGLIRAVSSGIELIMLIDGTPGWALKAGYQCGAVAVEQFPALGQFAYDLVKRYSIPPYNVRYWELWNEPDVYGSLGCWGDPYDNTGYYGGGYYGDMLRAVYPRIKEADADAQVLLGGLLLDCDPENPPEGKDCTPAKFLTGILERGGGPYFDGVSFHAYDFYTGMGTYENQNWHSSSATTGPVSISKINYLRSVLSEYGYSDKYLMDTETALFWGANVMEPPCSLDPPPPLYIEITKGYYVIQSYAVAVAEGLKANVWYSALGVRCSGLLNSDLSPKAGYYAYQFAREKLGSALFVRSINDYVGVMGYEYEIPGRRLWVIWSQDGQVHSIFLPSQPVEVNRVGEDGRAVQEPNNTTLVIDISDLSPRFVEFSK